MDNLEQRSVNYICGSICVLIGCGKDTRLGPNDPVKCTHCGYRILYKKRNTDLKHPIQY